MLQPYRAVRSVVIVYDVDVARAVTRAADGGCHVVSMSLGGIETPALQAAVNYAVARDVIVAAAAGNCVHFVTAPAAYPTCIAVAGSNRDDRPWPGSSRGPAVDITAPGENVWVGRSDAGVNHGQLFTTIGAGQGTSFAVANVAGLAALWLAFHGRDRLLQQYRGRSPLQDVFRQVLQSTARTPSGWDTQNYGPGIANADDLLGAALPAPAAGGPALRRRLRLTPYADLIAARYAQPDPRADGISSAVLRQLAALFELADDGSQARLQRRVGPRVERYGSELLHILSEHRDASRSLRRGAEVFGQRGARRPDGAAATAQTTLDLRSDLLEWASSTLAQELSRGDRAVARIPHRDPG
jgi:hypothetical protein